MDTRNKILDWSEAEEALQLHTAAKRGKVVIGYFDPLLASHALRLAEIAGEGKLFVLVTTPVRPILSPEARAELVAALAVVDHVAVVPPARLQKLIRLVPPEAVVLEQASDARRAGELVRHIHARQKA